MPLCKARQQLSNASRMKQTGPSVRMPVCTIIYAVISAYFIQQYHLFAVSLGDGEFVFSLPPCSSFLGAGSIGEEFQNYVIFIVGNALTQSIGKGIGGQVGRCGGDAGQSGNNLVIYNVAVGCGAGGSVAVSDAGGAVVLAGIVLTFPQGLVQGGIAGQVLGVYGYVVNPAISIPGGHGQTYEEEIAGAGDHFGNLGFHQQI